MNEESQGYQVDSNLIIKAYMEKVNVLTNELVVKDALIGQMAQRIMFLESQVGTETEKENNKDE